MTLLKSGGTQDSKTGTVQGKKGRLVPLAKMRCHPCVCATVVWSWLTFPDADDESERNPLHLWTPITPLLQS